MFVCVRVCLPVCLTFVCPQAALHMERISKINREVHGIHYNRIISEAAAAAASIEETSPMEMA